MSKFLGKYNSDDVYFRAVIAALLNFISEKIQIWNVQEGQEVVYNVPFYYNAGGDERFMQDIFQQHTLNDCIVNPVIEGNTDIIPRGHITLSGITVEASSLSNRFVRGNWIKEEGDEIVTYNSPMNIIPLTLNFDCLVKVDGILMSFKLIQRIIETFYKRGMIEFLWKGIPLKAYVGFPEDNSFEHIHEFAFGDDTINKITFNIEVQTQIPVMDMTQTFKESNSIESFTLKTSIGKIWPDRDMDGQNIYESDDVDNSNRVTTVNNDYIPDVMPTTSPVDYIQSLNPEDKVYEEGQGLATKSTPPLSKDLYSLKDRKLS